MSGRCDMRERESITVKPRAMPCPTCGYLIDAQRLDDRSVVCSECGDELDCAHVKQHYTSGGVVNSVLYDRCVRPAINAQLVLVGVALISVTLAISPQTSDRVDAVFAMVMMFAVIGLWIWNIHRARVEDPPVPIHICLGAHVVYLLGLLAIITLFTSISFIVAVLSISIVVRGFLDSITLALIGLAGVALGPTLWILSDRIERALIMRCRRLEMHIRRAAMSDRADRAPL
jgi:hypothetical protein